MDFLPFRETRFLAGVLDLRRLVFRRDLRYAIYATVAGEPLVSFLGRLTTLTPFLETFLFGAALEALLTDRLFGVLGTVFDFRTGEAFRETLFREGVAFLDRLA